MSFSSNLGVFLDAKSHIAEGSFIRSIFRLSRPVSGTIEEDSNFCRLGMSKKYRLMIVEDDEDVRELIEGALSSYGPLDLEIYSFDYAEKAVVSLSARKYDLIITDFKLPGMDGFEFIQKCGELSGDKSIPVLFVSGYFNDLDAAKNASKFDNVMFVSKPFEVDKLVSKVALFLLSKDGDSNG